MPLLDEALALYRRIEFPYGIALTLGERAHAARMQGDQILAARLFVESIAVAEAIGDRAHPHGCGGGAGRRRPGAWATGAGGRLLGAVEAAGRRAASAGSPTRPHTERITAEVRAALAEPAFAAAWDGGGTLPLRMRSPTPSPSPHPP